MAEALGIASGAAGLLSLAIEVTKLSYTYIASVRGAPKSLTSYIAELTTLTSVLLQLEDLIQAKRFNSQNSQALSKALHDCQREIEHLRAKLEKKLSYGRIKAKVAALAWPLSESELLDKVNMLHRYNGIFSSALQADNLYVARLGSGYWLITCQEQWQSRRTKSYETLGRVSHSYKCFYVSSGEAAITCTYRYRSKRNNCLV